MFVLLLSLAALCSLITAKGWTEAELGSKIEFDIDHTPLEIQTKNEAGTFDAIRLNFLLGGDIAGGIEIAESADSVQLKVLYCGIKSIFSDVGTIPATEKKVWRVSVDRTEGVVLIVHCNDVEIFNVKLTGSGCWDKRWRDVYARSVDEVEFADAGEAAGGAGYLYRAYGASDAATTPTPTSADEDTSDEDTTATTTSSAGSDATTASTATADHEDTSSGTHPSEPHSSHGTTKPTSTTSTSSHDHEPTASEGTSSLEGSVPGTVPGTYPEGTYSEGTYSEGTHSQGTYSEGSYSEGTYSEGTFSEGTYSEGTYSQGTYSEGSYSEGSYSEGTTPGTMETSPFHSGEHSHPSETFSSPSADYIWTDEGFEHFSGGHEHHSGHTPSSSASTSTSSPSVPGFIPDTYPHGTYSHGTHGTASHGHATHEAAPWATVQSGSKFIFHLEHTPLEFKTHNDAMRLNFFDESELAGALEIMNIGPKVQIRVLHCGMQYSFTPLPSVEKHIWRVTMDRSSGVRLIVHCSDEEIFNIKLSSSLCTDHSWHHVWTRKVEQVKFSVPEGAVYSSGSAFHYRPFTHTDELKTPFSSYAASFDDIWSSSTDGTAHSSSQSHEDFWPFTTSSTSSPPNEIWSTGTMGTSATTGTFGTMRTASETMGTETVSMGAETHSMGTEPHSMGAETGTFGTEPHSMGAETGTFETEPHSMGAETGTMGTESGTMGTIATEGTEEPSSPSPPSDDSGWTAVEQGSKFSFDMEDTPLQIRAQDAAAMLDKITLNFYNGDDVAGGLEIAGLEDSVQMKVLYCGFKSTFDHSLDDSAAGDHVWTISLVRGDRVKLQVQFNGMEIFSGEVFGGNCWDKRWRDVWAKTVDGVEFSDGGALLYRAGN